MQEASGRIAAARELPAALAQLAAVRHSLHGGPVAADLAEEFAAAAAAAQAGIESALACLPPGGQPCSESAAADLAAQLACLKVAASETLPAAAADELRVTSQQDMQLAVAVLQCPAAQVNPQKSSSFCPCSLFI